MLRAFWLLQFYLDLRGAAARGRLFQWPSQDLDTLLTSSVGDFFELDESTRQQILTAHDFLSESSALTDSGIIPCTESPSCLIGEDRFNYPTFEFWSNQAMTFHNSVSDMSLLGPFAPYRGFGFAIWDDQRMMDLGFLRTSINPAYGFLFYSFRWWSIVSREDDLENRQSPQGMSRTTST